MNFDLKAHEKDLTDKLSGKVAVLPPGSISASFLIYAFTTYDSESYKNLVTLSAIRDILIKKYEIPLIYDDHNIL